MGSKLLCVGAHKFLIWGPPPAFFSLSLFAHLLVEVFKTPPGPGVKTLCPPSPHLWARSQFTRPALSEKASDFVDAPKLNGEPNGPFPEPGRKREKVKLCQPRTSSGSYPWQV